MAAVLVFLQRAEDLHGQGEAGATGEGGSNESRRRRGHSSYREGDEPQGKTSSNQKDALTPFVKGLASNWDLDMFREAQAKASKVIEEQLKGLPDVKGTKYMEMGRHQMEVSRCYKLRGNYISCSRCGTSPHIQRSTQSCLKSTSVNSVSNI